MQLEKDYDIVIVGAGPAGSTLARLLAKSRYRVLLLNGQREDRAKACGGLLAPDAQKALAGFDLTLPKRVLVDPQIFSVKVIDVPTKRVRYYPRFYLNIDRYRFDQWLLSLVPPEISQADGRCLAAKRGGKGFLLTLRLKNEAETRQVETHFLVGADGADSLVRRYFFPGRILRYVAIQQWFRAEEGENPFYSCIFDPKTSDSCSWSIYKDDYLIYGGAFPAQNCRAAFQRQKEKLAADCGFSFGAAVKTEACQLCRPRRMGDFHTGRDGVFLVGEAAGFISPSSFEGISSAILSGKYLGEAFAKASSAQAVAAAYRRATLPLRLKLRRKGIKRIFMYRPFLRGLIMFSGLQSIDVDRQKTLP